jgi:hypothetical protein
MAEFARVLNPNGRAVFIWNNEGQLDYLPVTYLLNCSRDADKATGWVHQVGKVVKPFQLVGTPQHRLGLWRQNF